MLISSIIFRNLPWFRLIYESLDHHYSSIIKKYCLVTVLSVAGLSIDLKTLKVKILSVLRLTILPQIFEAVA